MTHEIETKRLLLSQLTRNDYDDFINLITNEEVIKYCFDPLSAIEVKNSFESRIKYWDVKQAHWLTLSVYLKETGEFIGVNGFRNTSNLQEVEVGFMYLPKFQGQGFASESLEAVLRFALSLGYESLVANVSEPNVASTKVLEKCKFEKFGEGSEKIVIGGNVYNNVSYFYKRNAIT